MRLIAQTRKACRRRNSAFHAGWQSIQQTVRADVSEVSSTAELIGETHAAVKLDAVETSIVKVNAHEHRTRRRRCDKHDAVFVLTNNLFTAEKRAGRTCRQHERLVEIDVGEFECEAAELGAKPAARVAETQIEAIAVFRVKTRDGNARRNGVST